MYEITKYINQSSRPVRSQINRHTDSNDLVTTIVIMFDKISLTWHMGETGAQTLQELETVSCHHHSRPAGVTCIAHALPIQLLGLDQVLTNRKW